MSVKKNNPIGNSWLFTKYERHYENVLYICAKINIFSISNEICHIIGIVRPYISA